MLLQFSLNYSARGMGITNFFNLSADKNDRDFNRLFNYFVAVRINHYEYSIPIPLNKVINRMCFSISDGTNYVRQTFHTLKGLLRQIILVFSFYRFHWHCRLSIIAVKRSCQFTMTFRQSFSLRIGPICRCILDKPSLRIQPNHQWL